MAKAARIAKLTKRTVDAAAPDKRRRYIIWDEDLAGFGLRIEPSGRKTFLARYRAGGGRNGTLRQETIGRFGTLTAEQARAKAKKTLGSAAIGSDPVGEKRAARQKGITVAEVCDWYLKEAESGRLLGRRGRPIKASTLATDRMRIKAHIKPLIGSKAVQSLTVRDMEQMQADISMHKTAKDRSKDEEPRRGGIPRGGAGTAGRSLGMVRTIFEHAVRHGIISGNPARGARKFADAKRKSRLTLEQISKLGEAMRKAEAADESPTGLAVIRLILLTGFRRGEALGIRRGWLMPAGGVDFRTPSQARRHVPSGVRLSAFCGAQFESDKQDFAFPSDDGDGHFVGLPKVLKRVAMLAKLKNVTPHMLRHTYASIAAELGFSELVIAGLLGHSAASVTSQYVHLDSALVTAADRVSAVIADALAGRQGGAVVALQKRATR